MNKIIVMGHLGKDPDVRYTNNGLAVASFSVAVRRMFSKDDATDWFSCTAFGKTGEFVEKYLKSGTKVLIEGSMQNDNYEKNGVKHYGMKLIVNTIEFAESKSSQPAPEDAPEGDFMPVDDSDDDGIPFA